MAGKNVRGVKASVKKRALIITAIAFLVLLIPASTVALFSYTQARAASVRITADREILAGLAGTALSAKLTKLAGIISAAVSSKELIADVTAGHFATGMTFIRSFENNPALSDPYIERTALLNANGVEMASYPMIEGGAATNTTTWDIHSWYPTLANGSSFYISGVTDVDTSSSLATDVVIAVPIKSGSNETVGFGLIQIPTEKFLTFDGNISVGGSGYVYLVDQNSNIVANPMTATDAADIVSDASDSAADLALAGQSGTEIQSNPAEQETNFVAYAPVPEYHWGVIITEPYQEAFAAAASIMLTMEASLALFAGIAIVALLLLFYFLNRTNRYEK